MRMNIRRRAIELKRMFDRSGTVARRVAAEIWRRGSARVGAWLSRVARDLESVRQSPATMRAYAWLDDRMTRPPHGPVLRSGFGRLDEAAAWLRPRIIAAGRWANGLSREERVAVTAATVAVALLGNAYATAPFRRLKPTTTLQVAAFFENGWGGAFPSSLPTLKEVPDSIDVIFPLWHTVMPDGTIDSAQVAEVAELARSHGIGLVPVVTNAKLPGGDNSGVLRDRKAAKEAVRNMVDLVDRYGYDGLNLSFQLVPPNYRRQLTALAADLAAAMKDRGKVFFVSVSPRVDMPVEVSGAFDYATLGRLADAVVLLAYDRHRPDGSAGPIAPLDWVDSAVKDMAGFVPVSKLMLGIGSYGYDWPSIGAAGKVEYLPAGAALRRAEARGIAPGWDESTGEVSYAYTVDGVPRRVWFCNRSAAVLRVGLARRYGLRGVAFWRLGLEEDGFWAAFTDLRRR